MRLGAVVLRGDGHVEGQHEVRARRGGIALGPVRDAARAAGVDESAGGRGEGGAGRVARGRGGRGRGEAPHGRGSQDSGRVCASHSGVEYEPHTQ